MTRPVARATVTKAPAAPSAATSNVALGELAGRLDTANKTVAQLEDQLRRIDVHVADPSLASKKGELLALKKELSAKLKAELPKRDALKKEFDAAVATQGSARTGVTVTYARLQNVEGELANARSQIGPLAKQIQEKVAAAEAEAKKHKSGLAHPAAAKLANEANALGKQLKALDGKIAKLETAKTALTNEVAAREPKALEEAKKSPDADVRAAAKDSVDVADLASTKREQQVKVLGAPVVGVDAKKAVEVDVGRVNVALGNGNPANAAKLLALQLDSASREHQDALVSATTSQVAQIATRADRDPAVAAELVGAMKSAQGSARTALADGVAKQVTDMGSQVIQNLDAKMKNGEGLEEAYALAGALKKAGKPELAAKVSALVDTRVRELTDDFAAKNEKISGVKNDLGRLVAGFGPVLSGEQQQAAMKAFKERHAGEFEAFEASGAKLARAASFISGLKGVYDKGYELLPDALQTQGGQAVVTEAVRDLAKGKPTFLETSKDIGKLGKYAPQLVVKSLGQQALNLAAAGKTTEAKAVLDQLKAAGGVLKVEGKKIDGAIDALKKVVDGGGRQAVEAFDSELRKVKADAGAFNALKGLAWATSALAGIEHLGSEQLKTQVKGITEILTPTGESIGWGVQALVDAKKAAWTEAGLLGRVDNATNAANLAKTVGGFANGLGAVLEGVSAVQAFSKGEVMEGTGATMSAVGSAVFAFDALAVAAGMQAVPVWGQLAGAALIIGGGVVKLIAAERKASKKERAAEADAMAYLEAAGIDKARADELSDLKRADGRNVGMMLVQIAPAMGLTPKQLWDRVMKLPPGKIDDFVEMAKDLVIDDNAKISPTKIDVTDVPRRYSQRESSDPDGRVTEDVKYYPQSLPSAVEWTKKFLADNDV